MATVIQVKRGTASSWTSANTVLAAGEIGFETDTKKMKVGDGSTAWTSLAYTVTDGDISGVTAGTGLSGGGTSGSVTLTNSMATAIDAKADLIVGTGADTFDRLAVGANNTVLTADSSVSPTGLKWAAPSSGGMTLLSTTATTSGSTIRIQNIDQNYKSLYILIDSVRGASGGVLRLYANNTQSGGYFNQTGWSGTTALNQNSQLGINLNGETTGRFSDTQTQIVVIIDQYTNTSFHTFFGYGMTADGGGPKPVVAYWGGIYSPVDAITEINLKFETAINFIAGSVEIYGVK